MALLEPLDFESEDPVYGQIRDRIKFAIARGAYGANGQLPSVRVLARSLLVNPNTVIRVYRELELDGITYSHPGKGIFVAPNAAERCRRERVGIVEEKLRDGLAVARRANLNEEEIEKVWQRLKREKGENR